MSDLHIGEGCPSPYDGSENCYSVQSLRRAVAYVNANLSTDLLLITGDLTSSAEPAQYDKAAEILSLLRSDWVPLIGNHDISPYASTYNGPFAVGDLIFARTFGAHLRASPWVTSYPNATGHDELWNCSSTYQNVEVTIPLPGGGDAVIIGGDWNTRMPALPGYKGVLGQAALHDWPNGTWPWFTARLAAPRARPVVRAFMAQHQPFRCPWWLPNALFCFADPYQALIRDAMLNASASAIQPTAWWGVLSGHIHNWDYMRHGFYDGDSSNATSATAMPWFQQLETSACKGNVMDSNLTSAVQVLPLDDVTGDVNVTAIERYWYDSVAGQWHSAVGPPSGVDGGGHRDLEAAFRAEGRELPVPC